MCNVCNGLIFITFEFSGPLEHLFFRVLTALFDLALRPNWNTNKSIPKNYRITGKFSRFLQKSKTLSQFPFVGFFAARYINHSCDPNSEIKQF